METFLGKVASHIIENHHNKTSQLAVVLPSRRAVAYLKKELREKAGDQPIWMPDIFSIEDFIYNASGYEEIDPTALLIELFQIHQEIKNDDKASLENFLSWAPMMVQDFNAIDENLADARELFTFLSEAKALEKWRPDHESLTENEKQYVAFFRLLHVYYQLLRERLLAKRKAYQGMAIRALYESALLQNHEKWQHYIFAGFYALTKAEEELATSLKKQGMLTQFYDADNYYVRNKFHEAGRFLRNKINDSGFSWLHNYYKDKTAEINICGIPGNIGQARQAGQIIHNSLAAEKKNSQKSDILQKTAVILADESLLLPVLNSLPEEVPAINVTMGLPVNHTSTASLSRLILKIAMEKERYRRTNIHVDELLQILNLPVVTHLNIHAADLSTELLEKKKVYYTPEQIRDILPEEINAAICDYNGPMDLLEAMIQLMQTLSGKASEENQMAVETHSATIICDRLLEVQKILKKTAMLNSFSDLEKLLRKTVLNASLPFSGEPLQGMQVMGMLESRALDFEEIILLSVNEGSLPAGKTFNSLIPFDIRKKFGLPTYQDNDSIYAYHFYRLLQRAKKVHLLYNTEAGTLGGNEQSRFIKQLQHELPDYNPNIKLTEKLITPPPALAKERKISIPKDKKVMLGIRNALKEGEFSGLSASGLKTLINCSLQYYFRYVLRLKKTDLIEETIPMNVFGDVVHNVLEQVFDPGSENQGTKVNPQYLKTINVRTLVLQKLPEEYDKEMISSGRNKLMVDLAVNLIQRFLKVEAIQAKKTGVYIKSVEELLRHKQTIRGAEVLFKGKADRIDEINGITRIIDYKTGSISPGALSQKDDFTDLNELKSGEAVQVLFYDWVYSKMKTSDDNRQGGIMLLAKPKEHSIFFRFKNKNEITPELRNAFEAALMQKVDDLLNPELAFSQTEDAKKCEICDFKEICNR